ncbi:hypothetical protein JCM21142_83200 [Saccharicrinis fermentans DSM 9555 = JCM 21142]|uniref:DUF6377 domain-containing protein n=2 Tax=Saccharicrinis fermentans TaxID=982 RepID=W7Y8B6_9BACT|nr:hypothetical protein JCM21142_83200 [Saccharicrinis fermentans DSM 9555 = JCM 21142]
MDRYAELDRLIENENFFNGKKERRLDSLKSEILERQVKGKEWECYQLYKKVADEYATYVFDSAMFYFRGAIDLAYRMNHQKAIAQCQSSFGHLLVSVGYYKEAIDTLNKVSVDQLPEGERQDYFSYKVRAYYDLADYINDDFYSPVYREIAEGYVDSVLEYRMPNSVQPLITKALRFLAKWQPDSAAYYYTMAGRMPLSMHEQAVVHSCLGYICIRQGKDALGKEHLIKSTMADIKTATKEAISLMVLADFLMEHGEIERAYEYIQKAKEDAAFFGSKQRMLQVAEIFPVIEVARLLQEEKKRQKAVRYIWIVSALVIVVLIFLLFVYRQLFNLRKIWMVIQQNNKELKVLNVRLKEANKIKERYIGHFFNMGSLFVGKLEDVSKSLNTLLVSNDPHKLKAILKTINPKKERDELFHNFDEVFLKLFPSFIQEVNELVEAKNNYVLRSGQLLNTELRILALIRLGVEDNETMSQVLGVSINTIYTYKTKARNKSALSAELFFERLKAIKSDR